MVNIIEDTPLIKRVDGYDVILVGTNCYQAMRNGFQYDIVKKYPFVRKMNNSTKYGDIDKVGTILECENDNGPLITLLFISFGYNFKGDSKPYIDYDALGKCLRLCNILYKGKKVATTLIGCTHYDGNGDEDKVLGIINENMKDVDLDIYRYRQESYREIKRRESKEYMERKYGNNNKEL